MKTRTILYSDEGKVLTNGTNYGKIIYLANTENEADYYEITEDEYQEILKEQEKIIDGNIES